MKRLIVAIATAAALFAVTPATAFHHGRVPANFCGESPNAGGANPTAAAQVREHSQANNGNVPIPPAGTPAEERSPVVGPGATCPAPQK